MDDDYAIDDDLLDALASAEARLRQPAPQRIQQPVPQRLDRAPPPAANAANATGTAASKIVQPTPQALPTRGSGSSILVSPRQKGNPVLTHLKSVQWEYSDIPADYGLGLTTCALFLSLKYHRIHPEYIYTRIRNLQNKFNLRILLTMVDIPNHEDSIRELSKTSIINNVTVILCWSAAEAARYLEVYKAYEHAGFSAIQGHQATGYAERLVEFVTVPRAINKTDAVSLVSSFGSLKNAVNADPEQVANVSGWGERKVQAWCKVVEEPFRVRKAAKRRAPEKGFSAVPIGSGKVAEAAPAGSGKGKGKEMAGAKPGFRFLEQEEEDDEEDLEALLAAETAVNSARQGDAGAAGSSRQLAATDLASAAPKGPVTGRLQVQAPAGTRIATPKGSATSSLGQTASTKPAASSAREEEALDEGIAAALARLRQQG